MGKINFEFHAIGDEIINVINNSIFEYDLHLVSIQLFPKFTCELISKEDINKKNKVILNSRMIVLYNYEPNVMIGDYNVFLDKNTDGIIFEIGVENDEKLKESRISGITENKETLKIWKDIVKRFKDTMLKGAWVINPNNGEKEYYNNHYYTLPAKELFQKGIKIVPYTGWNEYMLEEEIL